jgi:hypothetical protein
MQGRADEVVDGREMICVLDNESYRLVFEVTVKSEAVIEMSGNADALELAEIIGGGENGTGTGRSGRKKGVK